MQLTFNQWLHQKVDDLNEEINLGPVFDCDTEPSPEELTELRRLAVIHRFLCGNLEELEAQTKNSSDNPLDRIRTREIERRERP